MNIDKFPGTLEKYPCKMDAMTYVMTEEQEVWFRKWFPQIENSVLMEESGMSHSTLHRFANKFGLKKSTKGLKGIRKRQARHIKRLCEKNGYYDSLKGRQPSEACIEASKRMWQEIREGRREHPFEIMKRKSSARYRKMLQRKSEERAELIRKEKMRQFYGLERNTRLRLPKQNYTRRQVSHRYNALKRGYYVMMDCSEGGGERWNIYYDGDTKRSEQFEKNLVADGFCIKEWKD